MDPQLEWTGQLCGGNSPEFPVGWEFANVSTGMSGFLFFILVYKEKAEFGLLRAKCDAPVPQSPEFSTQ